MRSAQEHSSVLLSITRDLTLIGIDGKDISRLLVEPFWKNPLTGDFFKMPDLIGLSYEDWAVIAEIKHSERKRSYAINQVMNGERYILGTFGEIKRCVKKIVYYGSGKIRWECLD